MTNKHFRKAGIYFYQNRLGSENSPHLRYMSNNTLFKEIRCELKKPRSRNIIFQHLSFINEHFKGNC